MNAKNKFIEDNKDRFDDLGFSIRTVKEAEDLLVANKSKFIEACLQRAKALAVQELAVEKYKGNYRCNRYRKPQGKSSH